MDKVQLIFATLVDNENKYIGSALYDYQTDECVYFSLEGDKSIDEEILRIYIDGVSSVVDVELQEGLLPIEVNSEMAPADIAESGEKAIAKLKEV